MLVKILKSDRNILAERAISRAETGLYFLLECLRTIHTGSTDAAYSRSVYILLSYNFELLLKSKIILCKPLTMNRSELDKKSFQTHNLENLSKQLTKDQLAEIDIKTIKKVNHRNAIQYVITTLSAETIFVNDFTDVRYDFVKEGLRPIDMEESKRIEKEIDILLKIIKRIKNEIYMS